MNRKNSYKHINEIVDIICDDKYAEMWQGIGVIASFQEQTKSLIPAVIGSDVGNAAAKANDLKNVVAKIANEPLVDAAVIFRPVIELSNDIKDFCNNDESFFINESRCFYRSVEGFIEIYTNLISGDKRLVLYDSCLQAVELIYAKDRLISLRSIANNLINKKSDHENSIELYLSNVESLKSFSFKVNAIALIYSQIMETIGASEDDEPLVIEHLEYGSFWLKFAGSAMATAIIGAIIPEVGGYLHNEYSISGQIKQKNEAISALHKLVDLEGKLKASGVDTSEMHEQIVASSKSVVRGTYDLLYDQADIEINDEVLSLGEDVKQHLIEQSKTLMLEHYEGANPLGPI